MVVKPGPDVGLSLWPHHDWRGSLLHGWPRTPAVKPGPDVGLKPVARHDWRGSLGLRRGGINNPGVSGAYDWTTYFEAVRGQGPRETLVRALDLFEAEDATRVERQWRFAVDLGCGEGRDLREILRRHRCTWWKAVGIDTCPPPQVAEVADHRWYFHSLPMEAVASYFGRFITYTRSSRRVDEVDLVNASFSLPFCDTGQFPVLWRWIVDRLKPGGRFAGQFFGVDDEWHVRPTATTPPAKVFHTRAGVELLLSGFEVEHLEEVNRPGKTSTGEDKHWHVFHVVGRKR